MDIAGFIEKSILPHWPFFTFVLVFAIFGQISKNAIFTKTAYLTLSPKWFFWWGRKTLPLHPILAGIVVGALWKNPDSLAKTTIASIGYFALAGALSVWAYEFLKGLAKKEGFDLSLPGIDDSVVPPPPSKDEGKK